MIYCAQKKKKPQEKGERNAFVCDDTLIKALWLDEESLMSPEYFDDLCSNILHDFCKSVNMSSLIIPLEK